MHKTCTRAGMSEIERPVLHRLDALEMPYRLVRHAATHRAADGDKIRASLDMPGIVTKTLLCHDKAKRLLMVVAPTHSRVDLKAAAGASAATGRLSFAAPEVMLATYGVAPGHLSPFALLNDRKRETVAVVLEASLLDASQIWGHPLHNEASVGISPADFQRFIRHHGPAPAAAAITA